MVALAHRHEQIVPRTEAEEPPLTLEEKIGLERKILAPLPEAARLAWVERFGRAFHELVQGSARVRHLIRHPDLCAPTRVVRHLLRVHP